VAVPPAARQTQAIAPSLFPKTAEPDSNSPAPPGTPPRRDYLHENDWGYHPSPLATVSGKKSFTITQQLMNNRMFPLTISGLERGRADVEQMIYGYTSIASGKYPCAVKVCGPVEWILPLCLLKNILHIPQIHVPLSIGYYL
jgi:hypothetical protein